MTESEWLAYTGPEKMLEALRVGGLLSERKARLFAAACCRRIWETLAYSESEEALLVAERFADGQASEEERARAAALAERAVTEEWNATGYAGPEIAVACAVAADIASEAGGAASVAVQAGHDHGLAGYRHDELAEQCRRQARLLHDLFGNPFRLVPLAPFWLAWEGGTVPKLARAAYEERELPAGTLDLARLAALADALEEAGCDQVDLLAHLRGPGPHVRGCWAIDLLLGQS
jgi:hypothetical protein